MTVPASRLLRDIVLVLALKVLAIALLWFLFVDGRRIDVDAEAVSRQIAPVSPSALTQQGEIHATR